MILNIEKVYLPARNIVIYEIEDLCNIYNIMIIKGSNFDISSRAFKDSLKT